MQRRGEKRRRREKKIGKRTQKRGERRCEQIISKRHLVGGEITRGEREVSCHNLMGEKGKTRPGKSLSEPEPV